MRRVLLVSVQTDKSPCTAQSIPAISFPFAKVLPGRALRSSALVAFTKRVGPPHAGILHA